MPKMMSSILFRDRDIDLVVVNARYKSYRTHRVPIDDIVYTVPVILQTRAGMNVRILTIWDVSQI